ncbi:hypothetical protein HXA32_06725 [Salipaludibacillus agaradhaerens]|nr:hypothetical protein [Salipaludibacillus agaradhaerens]MCR6105974.1 hypothetical protein [Salipaludibacillus agaradhaerens]
MTFLDDDILTAILRNETSDNDIIKTMIKAINLTGIQPLGSFYLIAIDN